MISNVEAQLCPFFSAAFFFEVERTPLKVLPSLGHLTRYLPIVHLHIDWLADLRDSRIAY